MKILFFVMFLVTSSFSSDILVSAKAYVVEKYVIEKVPKEFTLVASMINKNENFALVEAVPIYEDGSYVGTQYIEDLVFVICLQNIDGEWKVIYDLSRSDVPSDEEMKDMKKSFPINFPKEFLSDFWQNKLKDKKE